MSIFHLVVALSFVVPAESTYALLRGSGKADEDRASTAVAVLLKDATNQFARELHKGMTAPLNQSGYEQSLGNVAMTTFITRFIEANHLRVQDFGALQGFVMYFDGTCHKKAFKNLGEEMGDYFRTRCHSHWLEKEEGTLASKFLSVKSAVKPQELVMMKVKESMLHKAAGVAAAQRLAESSEKLGRGRLRIFIRAYLDELNGRVVKPDQFPLLIDGLVDRLKTADHPLDELQKALRKDSELGMGHRIVELPKLPSSNVLLDLDAKAPHAAQNGPGAHAELNEAGYQAVADLIDDAEMVTFINRTAHSLYMKPHSEQDLFAFAPWYNGRCAKQTFHALTSELNMIVSRPGVCGGSWLSPLVLTQVPTTATQAWKKFIS